MKKRLISILLTLVMLIGLLPTTTLAAIKDPIVVVPTTLTFTTEPQSGTALKTESYAYTWAINKTADIIVLEIQETNRLTGDISWKQLKTLTGTSGSGTLTYPSVTTQVSGGKSNYRISAGILGDTAADNELAVATFTVTWTDKTTYTVTVNGGTASPAGPNAEGTEVTITATPPANMGFMQWDGLDGVTFVDDTDKKSATATFKMPAKDVTATAVYGINNVIATATGNIKPVLGNNAETEPTFTYNFTELKTRANSCWRYSSDGEDFEYAGYIEGTENFCVGYWRFDLSVDLNGLSICNPCTITVNDTKWQIVPSVRIEAESPVYYLDAEGNVSVVMFEIDGVTATCAAMPESLSAEDSLPHLAFTPTPSQAVVRGDGTWQQKSGDTWVNVSGAAKAGNTYRYKTKMHIDSSDTTHTFTNDVTLKVNGKSWTVDYTTMQETGTSSVSVMVYSPEITVPTPTINTINIKGITAPVAGEAPVITGITTDTAGITLATIQWLKGGGVILNSSDKFEAGQTYYLYVRYEVADGYEVSGDVTITSDLENSTYEIIATRVTFQYTVPAAAKYTVTVTGGGTVDGKASVTTEAGTRLQLKAPAVSGKRFTGWSGLDGITFYGDNAKVTDPVLGFIMPAKNFTVTANYQDAVDITTINIKGITKPLAGANPVNFGVTTDTTGLRVKEVIWYFDRTPSTNVPHDYEFQLGDKLYLLVFLNVADGYTLANPVTITADLEYTAAYRMPTTDTIYIEYTVKEEMPAPTTYTISFDGNGGTGTMADVTGVSGEYELPACTFTAPSGKQFKAWSVGGVEKAVGNKITVTADTTVTAVWENVQSAVTVVEVYDEAFDLEGKSVVEVKLASGNGSKKITVNGAELYYSSQRDVYVGLVDASAVSGDALTGAVVTDVAPTKFVYGNVDGDYDFEDIDEAIDSSDLQALKRALKGQKTLTGADLIAADLDGDGISDSSDLQALKQFLKVSKIFPILK